MIITFTGVQWRNSDDCDVFNMHAIQKIELNIAEGTITITCATNSYKSPYCNYSFIGALPRHELTAMHPYEQNRYINIAIFENGRVAVIPLINEHVPNWFENKCKRFCY